MTLDADKLADSGMVLWSQLHKAEANAELGHAGDDIMDMPGVPNQEFGETGRKQGKQALNQVGELLTEILSDPEALQELSDEDLIRIREVGRWLDYDPGDDLQKAVDVSLSVKGIVRVDDYVLLLKDAYSDWWDLPGGHVQDGETLEGALQREIWEETSLDVTDLKELMVLVMTLGHETKPVVFYQVTPVEPLRGKLSEEHVAYKWVDLSDTQNYNLGEFHKVFTSGGHLIPGGNDVSVMRPAHETAGGPIAMAEEEEKYPELTANLWKTWKNYGHDINNIEDLRPGHVDEHGKKHTRESLALLKEARHRLQKAATQGLLEEDTVYRCEVADTPEELRVRYPRHSWMLTDKLIKAYATSEEALETASGDGPIKLLVKYHNPHGLRGVRTPDGDMVLPRGDRYRVAGLRLDSPAEGIFSVDLVTSQRHPSQTGIKKAVGYGDDLTNQHFEAMKDVDPNVDPRQAAVSAIQYEHDDPIQVAEQKEDGDVVLSCPQCGRRWYVTRDGEVFSDGLKA